jgi:hypothetical protein
VAFFRIVRRSPHGVEETWRRVTDWRRHAGAVPVTVARVRGRGGAGDLVVMRTGIGRVAFEDPMEIVEWEPPERGRGGRCRLEKRGRVVLGWAEIEVRPRGTGAWVVWREEARVRGLPHLFDGVTALGGRLIFSRVVGRLLR